MELVGVMVLQLACTIIEFPETHPKLEDDQPVQAWKLQNSPLDTGARITTYPRACFADLIPTWVNNLFSGGKETRAELATINQLLTFENKQTGARQRRSRTW